MNIKRFKRGEDVMLAPHFPLHEFECKCNGEFCDETIVDLDHILLLEDLREAFGHKPMTINSGYRCPQYNEKIGGSARSQHKEGTATDIVIAGISPDEVHQACENFTGLGKYNTFTHVDSREQKKGQQPARWGK